MKFRYGFLCDYSAFLAAGTSIAVGIFDTMTILRPTGAPAALLPHTIYVVVEDSSISPPRHLMAFRLIDGDGTRLFEQEMPFNIGNPFGASPGVVKKGNIHCRVENPIAVPDVGDFEWVIVVDGEVIGSIPFALAEATGAANPV